MTFRQTNKKSLWLTIALILGVSVMLFAAQKKDINAFAGSSWKELTFDETTFPYTKEGVAVTRNVYVGEELYIYLEKITYSVVSSQTNTVFTQQLRINAAGNVLNEDVDVERSNVLVEKRDLQHVSTGKKAYRFTVSCDHTCAFIFTLYYDNGEGQGGEVESQILYISSIDGVAPTVKFDSGNPFMNTVTCAFSDSTFLCASSGVKSYTVYQENADTKQKTVYYQSELSTKKATISLASGDGKFNYYVEAKDAVGNVSEQVLVAKYDVDTLLRSADNAVMTIRSSPDDWSEGFKDRLTKAYSEYEAIVMDESGSFTEEDKKVKAAALSAILTEYASYVSDYLTGSKNIDVSVGGKEYFGGGVELVNTKEACKFIKYGEEGALTLAVAKYGYTEDKKEVLLQSGMEKADEVCLFTVHLSTTEQVKYKGQFTVPLRLSLSVGDYVSVAAVQVWEENGEAVYTPCTVTEYTSGKIVLNVQNTYGTVYLFVEKEKKENTWWYLFFLLIPVAAGTVSAIILSKKYKRRKK